MLMAALKAKPYPWNTNTYNLKVNTVIFLKNLFPAWKFGDDNATDICVTMTSCSVRSLNV